MSKNDYKKDSASICSMYVCIASSNENFQIMTRPLNGLKRIRTVQHPDLEARTLSKQSTINYRVSVPKTYFEHFVTLMILVRVHHVFLGIWRPGHQAIECHQFQSSLTSYTNFVDLLGSDYYLLRLYNNSFSYLSIKDAKTCHLNYPQFPQFK